jgi:hypothetical protein
VPCASRGRPLIRLNGVPPFGNGGAPSTPSTIKPNDATVVHNPKLGADLLKETTIMANKEHGSLTI